MEIKTRAVPSQGIGFPDGSSRTFGQVYKGIRVPEKEEIMNEIPGLVEMNKRIEALEGAYKRFEDQPVEVKKPEKTSLMGLLSKPTPDAETNKRIEALEAAIFEIKKAALTAAPPEPLKSPELTALGKKVDNLEVLVGALAKAQLVEQLDPAVQKMSGAMAELLTPKKKFKWPWQH